MKFWLKLLIALSSFGHVSADKVTACEIQDELSLMQVQLKFHTNRTRSHHKKGLQHGNSHHKRHDDNHHHVSHDESHHQSHDKTLTWSLHGGLVKNHGKSHHVSHDNSHFLDMDMGMDMDMGPGHHHFPGHEKFACKLMFLLILINCCCAGALQQSMGDQKAHAISLGLSLVVFAYMCFSGIYGAWWRTEHIGLFCRIMCWWVLFQIIFFTIMLCCMCCLFGLIVGASIIIKNEHIKKLKDDYEKKGKLLSGPRKEYYQSDLFKNKCNKAFDKADRTRTGTLKMTELEDAVKEMLGDDNAGVASILREIFNEHGNSVVERDEFSEMMKFLSVTQLQDGRFTEEQAFEVLLLPDTATMSDVTKAYRKLAIRYHPDKRPGEDKDIVDKDMAEVNDAKSLLEKHFQELKDKAETAKEDSK